MYLIISNEIKVSKMFTGNIVTVSNTAKNAYNEVPGMVDIA